VGLRLWVALSSAVGGMRLKSGKVNTYTKPTMTNNDFTFFSLVQFASFFQFSRKDIMCKAATKQQITNVG